MVYGGKSLVLLVHGDGLCYGINYQVCGYGKIVKFNVGARGINLGFMGSFI